MGWKKMLVGEKMPDKDDPKYRQRYEEEVKAGRKFARTLKLDVLAIKVQQFANNHKRLFLALVFGFILLSFGFNIYRMVVVYNHQQSMMPAATDTADAGQREGKVEASDKKKTDDDEPQEVVKKVKVTAIPLVKPTTMG